MLKKLIFLLSILGVSLFAYKAGFLDEALKGVDEKKANVLGEVERLERELEATSQKLKETKESVENTAQSVSEAAQGLQDAAEKVYGILPEPEPHEEPDGEAGH